MHLHIFHHYDRKDGNISLLLSLIMYIWTNLGQTDALTAIMENEGMIKKEISEL